MVETERPHFGHERDAVPPQPLAAAQKLGLEALDVGPDEGDLVEGHAVLVEDLFERRELNLDLVAHLLVASPAGLAARPADLCSTCVARAEHHRRALSPV